LGARGTMHDGGAEAELLLKAARGDEPAFLLLYERHRTPVFRFACRMLGSSPLAEDVTQECFLSVLRRPEAFRAERASLRTYLCAIARHLALKQLRKRGEETTVDDSPDDAPAEAGASDPLNVVLQEEAAEAVRQAVAALPPLQREAVVLFEYQEMSLADIAATCEIDVGTVKSRLHRARERLRRTLAPWLAGGPGVAAELAGERDTRP
jgi:RNA polymerase sigma-70 factor (ECF subfamily)